MSRHFRLFDEPEEPNDRDGIEVANVEVARAVARETLIKMLEGGQVQAVELEDWQMKFTDANGVVLFTISLDLS